VRDGVAVADYCLGGARPRGRSTWQRRRLSARVRGGARGSVSDRWS
jgi:hypothetical protein